MQSSTTLGPIPDPIPVQIRVTSLKWGAVATSDLGRYKDAIVGLRSEEWDWSRFGLRHDPGYTEDVLRAIRSHVVASTPVSFRAGQPTIYLSTGIDQKIRAPEAASDSRFVYLQSEACVAAYNSDVSAGKPCVLFLHSTC